MVDQDGDGYGDETAGNLPDSCPTEFGNSTITRYGCVDSDGDGLDDELMLSHLMPLKQLTLMVMELVTISMPIRKIPPNLY